MQTESRQPEVALLMWGSDLPAQPAQWRMCLGFADGGILPMSVGWERPQLPSLMERYDALTYMGYAVAEGGPEAWTWREGAMSDGSPCLLGEALIRPLTPEEMALPGSVGSDALG